MAPWKPARRNNGGQGTTACRGERGRGGRFAGWKLVNLDAHGGGKMTAGLKGGASPRLLFCFLLRSSVDLPNVTALLASPPTSFPPMAPF